MTTEDRAVILLGYGAPSGLDDIERFLTAVFGSPPAPPIVEATRARYRAIGGASPLVRDLVAFADVLTGSLAARGVRVYAGFRFSAPSIADAVARAVGDGATRLVGLPFTPFYSAWSWEGYRTAFDEAVAGCGAACRATLAEPYHDHPLLARAWAEAVRGAIAGVERPFLVFTAHSLPLTDAAAAEVYPRQVAGLAGRVAEAVGVARFAVAYQSVGRRGGEWLGPTVETLFSEPPWGAAETPVVVPIGFLSENIETLFDLDIELNERARARGHAMVRVPTPLAAGTLADAFRGIVSEIAGID